MEIIITLIVAALLGLIPAKIAQSKGYSFGKWWIYGFLIFIVAIIHACKLKSKTPTENSSNTKKTTNANLEKIKEQAVIVEESLITTGLPPQNTPTAPVSFFQMLLLGILLSPIVLGIFIGIAKSNTTKQQNRVKEARIQRGITLSTEAYTASEAYFDKQRAEASKAIFPAIIAWVILVVIILIISGGNL
jgi:hypothetical protein